MSSDRVRIALLSASLVVAGAIWAPASFADRFRAFATCNALAGQQVSPGHVCFEGDPIGGVFIAKRKDDVRYKVCVNRPNESKECFGKRTHDRGEKSPNWTNPNYHTAGWLGKYRFSWRVPGRGVVERDRLVLKSEGV